MKGPWSIAGAALMLASLATSCAPDARKSAGAGERDVESNVESLEQPMRAAPEREWFLTQIGPANLEFPRNRFGTDVALSGNTAVVTDPADHAVYVFVLANDGWQQQVKLLRPADSVEDFDFPSSIAISGDTLVVGAFSTSNFANAPGRVYVYERSGATWGEPVPLSADDGGIYFGRSIAVLDDRIVVGAPSAMDMIGAAYVFTRSGSMWTQTDKLVPEADRFAGNEFGWSVAVWGTTILVGAPLAPESNFQGKAYFFTRSGADWSEQQVGQAVPYCCDELGRSVALGENIAVVGAPSHRGRFAGTPTMDGYREGAALVFTKSTSGLWTFVSELVADDGEERDAFGTSVAVSGSTVMVGAPGQGSVLPPNADTVYLFEPLTDSIIRDRIGTRGDIPFFGDSVALEGDVAVIGTISGQSGAWAAEYRIPNGGPCDSSLDCQERHCVAGVCCNEPCPGECQSCSTGECTLTPQSPGTPTCEPFLCTEASGECPTFCTANSHCIDTHYCRNGDCVPRLPNGERCTEGRGCVSGTCTDNRCAGSRSIGASCASAVDCVTGFCTDGFCCDQTCEGQCEACDLRDARGVCSPVTGAPRGEREPCEGTDTECGGECNGVRTVRCTYEPSDTRCGASSCTDDEQTDSFCNGQGQCVEREPFSCNNFRCDDEFVCKTSCDENEDCVSGTTCQDGTCAPGASCFDPWTAQSTDGTPQNCRPYLCDQGSCKMTCDASEECTDDHVCVNGSCDPRPVAASTSDSGGCSLARARARASRVPGALWGFSMLAALAWRASRARKIRSRSAQTTHGGFP